MLTDAEKKSQRHYVADNAIWLYPRVIAVLPEVSEKTGYAFAVHGSQQRDLDIVAVAWVDNPLPVPDMVRVLCERIGRFTRPCEPVHDVEHKPHGRVAVTITLNYGCWIDLSIIPPLKEVVPQCICTKDWHEGNLGPDDSN